MKYIFHNSLKVRGGVKQTKGVWWKKG